MKSKNKLKLFGAAAALAAIATPVITLASCNKTPDIDIDESEKTKELERGSRDATYTFKLASRIADGETFEVSIQDMVSTQEGYGVEVGEVKYVAGSETIVVNVQIVSTSDAILQEGTKFTFSLTIVKKDKAGKEVTKTTMKDFCMTYASVPTAEGLTIADAKKKAYSNPASVEHTFVFNVNTKKISIPYGHTFECDVTTKSTSTEGYSAIYKEAVYDETTNKLKITFALNKEGTEECSEKVDFDFTISCLKDGKELWRQSFSDFTITYLYHQMYIFEDVQQEYWPATYAGEKEFHIYIARNPEIHWGDPQIKPSITFKSVTGATKIAVDGLVTEPPKGTHTFDYFDVPVKITPTSEDTDATINFVAVVSGKINGEVKSNEFPLSIKYVAKKLNDDDTVKKPSYIAKTNGWFDFKLNDTTNLAKIDATLNQTSETTYIKASVYNTTISETTKVRTVVNVHTSKTDDATANFNLSLKGKNAAGEVLWEQRINDLSIHYVDPIKFGETTFETELGQNSGLLTYTTKPTTNITAQTVDLDAGATKDVKSISIDSAIGDNPMIITLTPNTGMHFNAKTSAPFLLTIKGTYGDTPEAFEKTVYCKMSYKGYVSLVSAAVQDTKPGERTIKYTFNKYNDYKLKAHIINEDGTPGYKVSTELVDNGNTVDLNTTIYSNDGVTVENDAYRTFNIVFEALNSKGESVWAKTYTEVGTTPLGFKITYKSAVKTNDTDIYTTPRQTDAKLHLQNVGSLLKNDEYFELEVVDQTVTSGITVGLPTRIYKPDTAGFDVGIEISKTTPFVDRDCTYFNLQVKKCASDGTVLSLDKVSGFKVTYIGNTIAWDTDDWYVADHDTSEVTESVEKEVKFNLAKQLESNEKLYATVTVTDASSNNMKLLSTYTQRTAVTPTGTIVKIPMKLKTLDSEFTVGNYVKYSIKFECVDETKSKTIWADTITDTCLYMLTTVTCSPSQKELTTEGEGVGQTYSFALQAEITQEMISSGAIKITAAAKNISSSTGAMSITVGNPTRGVSPLALEMPAYLTGTIVDGEYVTFDVDVTLETAYGSATFEITGLKLTKATV